MLLERAMAHFDIAIRLASPEKELSETNSKRCV